MTTPRTPWRASAAAVVATISPAGWLAALHDLIVAEVAANPSTAQWTVSDYSSVNGTLELKKLQTVDDVRLLLFGGAVPHADALWQTAPSADFLHCLLCPTAGTTGPTTAFTAGAPYAEPSTLGAAFLSTVATVGQTAANRIRYFENDAGIVIVGHNNESNAHTGCVFVGNLADDPDSGAPVWQMLASGASTNVTDAYSARLRPNALSGTLQQAATTTAFAPPNSGRFWNMSTAGSLPTAHFGLPNTVAIRAGAPAQCIGALFGGAGYNAGINAVGGMTPNLKDTESNKSFLIPAPISSVTTTEFLGHLRQIMVGPRAPLGHILNKDGVPYARAISCDPLNAADTLWLVD